MNEIPATMTAKDEADPKVAEALARALDDKSHANYVAIVEGFSARGIPVEEIQPRANVFTYNAWKALGRQVRRGEHGVKIGVVVEKESKDRKTGAREKKRFRKTTTVFHVTQTDPIDGSPGAPPPPPKKRVDTNLAEKFRETAHKLEFQIDELERPMTARYTAKRNMYHRDKLHTAQNCRQTRLALLALAEAIESGNLPAEVQRFRSHKDVANAMRLQSEQVPNGYYAYSVTKHGCYHDDSPEARALQQLVAGDAAKVFAEEARKTEILRLETQLRGIKIPGFFPTPKNLATAMVLEADIEDGMEVLEPSAGIGSLAEVIRQYDPQATILCVEQHPQMCRVLELKGFDVVEGEFLQVQGEVDRVVMNPPFERRQDAAHIRHAYSLLKPGGRLVALISKGTLLSTDAIATEFREWFTSLPDAHAIDVDPKAFDTAEAFRTTTVGVSILVASA